MPRSGGVFSGASQLGAFGALGGTISFEWTPDPAVLGGRFIMAADYFENMIPPLTASRAIAIADMNAHFDTESSPEGAPWAPLDEDYAEKRGSAHPILNLTGDLRSSATSPGAYPIDGNSVYFTTAGLPFYWEFHEEGTGGGQFVGLHSEHRERVRLGVGAEGSGGAHEGVGIGRGNALPARPFVGISEAAELQIIEVFDMWFDEGASIAIGGGGIVQQRGAGGRFGQRLYPDVGMLMGEA